MTVHVSANTNNDFLERHTSPPAPSSGSVPATVSILEASSIAGPDMSVYDGSDNGDGLLRRRNVARNLFGVPTAASAQYAKDKLREMLQRESARWNFDFEAERPLPGRFRWEPVQAPIQNPLPSSSKPAGTALPKPPGQDALLSSSGPTPAKQRRLGTDDSLAHGDQLLISSSSSSASCGNVHITGSSEAGLKRKVPIITPTTGNQISPNSKSRFPPSASITALSGGSNTPPPSPPQLDSVIPATVLVTATAVDPLDDASRKYLRTDSSRRKEKQMKITMYSTVKKRRIGHGTAGTEKKAAF